MPILKFIEENSYTQIPNILAQNTELSYEALGVLINLLSRPKDWRVYKISFKRKGCGDVVLNRIFNELQASGYLFMKYIMENNKITDKVWIVSSHPIYHKDPNKQREMWLEVLDDQSARKPIQLETNAIGNHELQIKNNTNKEKSKKERNIYTENFLAVWELYPHGLKKKQEDTWKNWKKALKNGYTEEQLMQAAVNYKKFCEINKTETKFRTYCSNFYGIKAEFIEFIAYDFTKLQQEQRNAKQQSRPYSSSEDTSWMDRAI